MRVKLKELECMHCSEMENKKKGHFSKPIFDAEFIQHSYSANRIQSLSDIKVGLFEYDFEKLKKSIQIEGLKNKLIIYKRPNKSSYGVKDGNHRVFALKQLYDDDHEVEVEIINFESPYLYLGVSPPS
jgi:hypothetical protein